MATANNSAEITSKAAPLTPLLRFMKNESAAGIGLIIATIAAMVIANSDWQSWYNGFLHHKITIGSSSNPLKLDVHHWVNDGLMAVFFLFVGLEIKREALTGHLSSPAQLLLPSFAAIGGMAAPAFIFYILNKDNPATVSGWAIPAATDIAFAIGVISLLGQRVPLAVKVFLTALAVIDDLGAIVIIALFYSKGIDVDMLTNAGITLAVLVAMNRLKVMNLPMYVVVGGVLWYFVFQSGLHATLAGVALAFCVPMKGHDRYNHPVQPLQELEHGLYPWVNFIVLPLFAFANAGVSFAGMSLNDLFTPVTMGIAAGLFFGKQIGVMFFTWLAVVLKMAPLPSKSNWKHVYGASIMTGIGFTMSLFISNLAYDDASMVPYTRLGVLTGSLLSAVFGFVWLRYVAGHPVGEIGPEATAKEVEKVEGGGAA